MTHYWDTQPFDMTWPTATELDLDEQMADTQFIADVVDGLFADETWQALADAYKAGGATSSLRMHAVGETFAKLFEARARATADNIAASVPIAAGTSTNLSYGAS